MSKKQQHLQLYKILTRVFVFYTIPPVCRKRRPPSKSLGNRDIYDPISAKWGRHWWTFKLHYIIFTNDLHLLLSLIFRKRFRNKRHPRINAALETRRNQSFVPGTAPDRRDIFLHTYKKIQFLVKRFYFPMEVKISNKKGVTLWPLTKNVLFFVFYTSRGLCRKRRPWSKFCITGNCQKSCCVLYYFSA